MNRFTDWASLWRELVLGPNGDSCREGTRLHSEDVWRRKSRSLDAHAKRKAAAPDPIRDFVLSQVHGESSVLDIGAGTGKWAVPLAARVRQVTALDSSPTMLAVLRENLAAEGAGNVRILQGAWPDTGAEPHDITICSHAVYGVPELVPFIRRMVEVTRRTCYLVLKSPARGGLMAEASSRIWGHPHDSPCFAVAYNVLLEMDILANVLVDPAPWDPWVHSSLEEALSETKRRLRISGTTKYDEYLMGLLKAQLAERDGAYVWPKSVRSVLVYWDV
jgi:2-polyprenyl-3-methyl-5-hydroxy-6-metoxy-1,4-benzoquinol methylase